MVNVTTHLYHHFKIFALFAGFDLHFFNFKFILIRRKSSPQIFSSEQIQ